MKVTPWFLMIYLCSCNVRGQQPNSYSSLKFSIKILNKSLTLTPKDEQLTLDVMVKNLSDTTFIFPDFFNLAPGITPIETFSQPNHTAQFGIYVFNGKDFLFIFDRERLSGSVNFSQDSAAFVDERIKSAGNSMLKNKLIIKRRGTWTGTLTVKVFRGRLVNPKKTEQMEEIKLLGDHELFLMYSCGSNISNLINPKIIQEIELLNDAFLFQGFIKSNSIKLTIKE